MRRKVFEDILPEALSVADAVVLGPVNRAQLLAETERLVPERITEELRQRGRPARACASVGEIAEYLSLEARAGDVILVMSNGSFDGLCGRLLEKLGKRGDQEA
jgi:UDP-N-acetylmuramate: L-alanyl-gamma-D-glutamyl-meso-diaminopimelate ligase